MAMVRLPAVDHALQNGHEWRSPNGRSDSMAKVQSDWVFGDSIRGMQVAVGRRVGENRVQKRLCTLYCVIQSYSQSDFSDLTKTFKLLVVGSRSTSVGHPPVTIGQNSKYVFSKGIYLASFGG